MKRRLWPKPAPLLVVALIALLSAHVAFLHAAVGLREWSWAAIGGVTLLITLKAALILHLRKKKRTGGVITSGSKGTRDSVAATLAASGALRNPGGRRV